ncbi:hypothetical protein LG200_06470 [Methylobacillus caricis]|uniref:hypothetical protein n=1 Tax=Methylobacillus caricis TaxID=1971611 RepID=UPI001CFFBEB9|nr:hypothetical protein [Methylobacillus caricis]MCB5187649.1 hypothetical protein [Methylobacillus caricis]
MLPAKAPVKTCLITLLDELIAHDGFGSLKVDIRLLRRGQKEIIIDCGKQYRFVVDFQPTASEDKNNTVQPIN